MLLSVKNFGEEAGVTPQTVRNWCNTGRINFETTKGKHRRINRNELRKVTFKEKITISYARVSTRNKLDDLLRQKQVLELYCSSKGFEYKTIEDVGSGLNYTKKGLNELIHLIETEQINNLVITHKDRLLRFGSEIIFKLCEIHHINIHIINRDEEKTDFTKELVDDVLSIITVFSAKLYGSSSGKNKKIVEENEKFFNEKPE